LLIFFLVEHNHIYMGSFYSFFVDYLGGKMRDFIFWVIMTFKKKINI
jgi:hypothetical protein